MSVDSSIDNDTDPYGLDLKDASSEDGYGGDNDDMDDDDDEESEDEDASETAGGGAGGGAGGTGTGTAEQEEEEEEEEKNETTKLIGRDDDDDESSNEEDDDESSNEEDDDESINEEDDDEDEDDAEDENNYSIESIFKDATGHKDNLLQYFNVPSGHCKQLPILAKYAYGNPKFTYLWLLVDSEATEGTCGGKVKKKKTGGGKQNWTIGKFEKSHQDILDEIAGIANLTEKNVLICMRNNWSYSRTLSKKEGLVELKTFLVRKLMYMFYLIFTVLKNKYGITTLKTSMAFCVSCSLLYIYIYGYHDQMFSRHQR